MNNPIERYRRLKADLDSIVKASDDFVADVAEIGKDPFTSGPSKPIADATADINEIAAIAKGALKKLFPFGQSLGAETDERAETDAGTFASAAFHT